MFKPTLGHREQNGQFSRSVLKEETVFAQFTYLLLLLNAFLVAELDIVEKRLNYTTDDWDEEEDKTQLSLVFIFLSL